MSTFVYIFIIVCIMWFTYMWIEAHRNRLREHHLYYDRLPAPFSRFRIFFISDVHRRTVSETIIRSVQKKDVDCVIIGGDLCERWVKKSKVEENVRRLSSIAPTFFIWGNNDSELGRDYLRTLFKKYNVTELVNELYVIKRDSAHIAIVGVGDLKRERDNLQPVVVESEPYFSILVTHFPSVVPTLPSSHPFSLVLSGHTHGGQIRLFGWGLEKKGALHTYETFDHLISNGYGTTGLPFRFGAPAEAHIITLNKKD